MTYEMNFNEHKFDAASGLSFGKKIDDLLDVSPSDANASSLITKTKAGYNGVLEIVSAQGRFIAETAARDLDEMLKALFESMHRQMKSWRKSRFLPKI